MLAEFRVFVQVEETPEDTVSRMREFIRACVENLDGVNAVEVEPLRGSMREPADAEVLRVARPTQ